MGCNPTHPHRGEIQSLFSYMHIHSYKDYSRCHRIQVVQASFPPLHWANWRTWQSADSFWATNELSAPLTTLVFFILSLLNEPRRATHLYILAVYINTKLYIPLEKFRLWSVSRKPSWLLLLEQFHKPSDHNEHPSTQFRGMVLALTIVVLLLCFWNQSRQYATSKPEITIFTLSVRQWGK